MGHRGARGGQWCPWATFDHDRHFVAKALEVRVRICLCWGGGGWRGRWVDGGEGKNLVKSVQGRT